MKIKKCNGCHKYLPLNSFHKSKKHLLGRVTRCKECVAKRSALLRKQPGYKIKKREKNRLLKLKTLDNQRLKSSRYYNKHKDIHAAGYERYRKLHPDRLKAYATLRQAVKKGIVIKPNRCELPSCQKKDKVVAYYLDYSKPCNVVWVCNPCSCVSRRGKVVAGLLKKKEIASVFNEKYSVYKETK